MMRQYELVERVRRYNPQADEDLLNRAYVFAMKAHGAQKRASGDPYFSHPLEVAAILTEFKLDDATIVAAMLHDTIEDTPVTRDEIDTLFGAEIGGLVDGLTKLNKLDFASKHAEQAENFRKLLLAIADDARVLLVKLADRLHNMRTLHFVPEAKRARIAQDTLDIYAPLAGRMGMQGLRSELEDLAFRYLMPEAHALIMSRLEELKVKNGALIVAHRRRTEGPVRPARHQGRRARPAEAGLFDLAQDGAQLDLVRAALRHLRLSHPRRQGRRLLRGGRRRAHHLAERDGALQGLHLDAEAERLPLDPHHGHRPRARSASNCRSAPTTCTRSPNTASPRMRSTRTAAAPSTPARAAPIAACGRSSRRCRATIPRSSSSTPSSNCSRIRCSASRPKGRLIALPRGATAIDFAYAVHTDVGNSAVGCKINGRIAPLISPLRNGDEVLITRSANRTPPAAWDSIVVTGRARAAIRRATREAAKAQFGGLGRQIVERAFERAGRKFSDAKLKSALPRLARHSIDDVFIGVGRGEIYSADVVRAIYPDFQEERKAGPAISPNESGWFGLAKANQLVFRVPGARTPALPLRGLEVTRRCASRRRAARCRASASSASARRRGHHHLSDPFAGAGRIRRQAGAVARRALGSRQGEEVAVPDADPGHHAQRARRARRGRHDHRRDRRQYRQCRLQPHGPDFREIRFDLEVSDIQHLNAVLAQLRDRPVVSKVERISG